ncbi:MAG TPA: SDR family oxidoreductase [Bacteroidia bacterium]|nr:SDR family oxidoreductase [Bacteroidia bacterium]
MYTKKFHSGDLSQYSFAITGGAGFIGSHLLEYLVSHNAGRIVVLDDLSSGSKGNLKQAEGYKGFEFIEGSICDINVCEKALAGVDFVMHQAALCSVPRSLANPIATNDVNVSGFLNILMAAKKNGVKRMVYASSSSVYGDSKILPKSEINPVSPLSPYAVSKYTNELYASVFARNYGMNLIGLRYFNIFGPRQSPDGPYAAAIPLFVSALLENRSPVIFGDGNQTRDFTFVENVVQANIKALFSSEEANGNVFNVACGERTTINQLFKMLAESAGSLLAPEYKPYRAGDVKDSIADVSKAKSLLGYAPEVNFNKGIETTWNWFNEVHKGKSS